MFTIFAASLCIIYTISQNTDCETYEKIDYETWGPHTRCFDCNDDVYPISNAEYPIDYVTYSCPPNECMNGYQAGDYWWDDQEDNNTLCQTFCYCPKNGGDTICATGYDDIFSDDSLSLYFMANCIGDSSENEIAAVKSYYTSSILHFRLLTLIKYTYQIT